MIKYQLKCNSAHEFEAWFPSIDAYDEQKTRGLVSCPMCGTHDVDKAPMAPMVKKEAPPPPVDKMAVAATPDGLQPEAFERVLKNWREHIENNFDYVGDTFAREARAMHEGEVDERPIYGEVTSQEAKELVEDGISIAPIPPMANPKSIKNLN